MRQTDENFVSMCKAVQDVLKKHSTVWTPIVAFKNQAMSFFELMTEIAECMEGTEIVSTGATQDKKNAEMKAVALTVNLAKRGSIYALDRDNLELHDQLRVSKTTLLRRPDTMTLAKLRDIHDRLNALISELADYGVLPEDLSELHNLTNAYEALVVRPRMLIVERKTYNQDMIPSLLSSIREVLYKMDSLVNLFEESAFNQEYKHARIVIDLGSRKSVSDDSTPPVSE